MTTMTSSPISYLSDSAHLTANVDIQKEFPALTHREIRRIIEIYYDHVRRFEKGFPNYTIDGSGCDL